VLFRLLGKNAFEKDGLRDLNAYAHLVKRNIERHNFLFKRCHRHRWQILVLQDSLSLRWHMQHLVQISILALLPVAFDQGCCFTGIHGRLVGTFFMENDEVSMNSNW
jgi:hypothetical protein